MRVSALCLCGLMVAQVASAGELIQVPPIAGAVETLSLGINDHNVITGFYFDSAAEEHGFYATLDGQYTFFDSADGSQIVPIAIDNNGTISGFTTISSQSPCDSTPFLRSSDGIITIVKKGKKPLIGFAAGFGPKGEFVGSYCDKDQAIFGYVGRNGKYKNTLTLGDTPLATLAYAINKDGDVAGGEIEQFGENGFLLLGGVFEPVFYPGAASTLLTGLNDSGLVAGTARSSQGGSQAFILDTKTGVFSAIPAPGFASGGINNKGFVIITNGENSLVYCPLSKRKCNEAKQAR
jgi:hypothetical protein